MAGAAAKKSGVVVPHKPDWKQRIGAFIIWLLIRAVSLTIRHRLNDRMGIKEFLAKQPVIYGFWHDALFLSPALHQYYIRRQDPGSSIAGLTSASRDGGFLAAILEEFGIQPVRGSSSRRGAQALLELSTWAERGYSIAVTPDGPRGPRHVLQEGIMSLAQITGLPIVIFTPNVRWKFRLKSWDGFQIPIPFSPCVVECDGPFHVPRECTAEEREKIRLQVQNRLNELCGD